MKNRSFVIYLWSGEIQFAKTLDTKYKKKHTQNYKRNKKLKEKEEFTGISFGKCICESCIIAHNTRDTHTNTHTYTRRTGINLIFYKFYMCAYRIQKIYRNIYILPIKKASNNKTKNCWLNKNGWLAVVYIYSLNAHGGLIWEGWEEKKRRRNTVCYTIIQWMPD